MPSSPDPAIPGSASVLGSLLENTSLVFLGYLAIGLEAAVVPSFVHLTLGYGTTLAGLTLGAQSMATLSNRFFAGALTDRIGPRATVTRGLGLILASGLLFALSGPCAASHRALAWVLLVTSRLALGWAIGWVSTAGTVWGIGRAGAGHTGQVVAWSGVASYGSLALGAPAGLWIARHAGLGWVGALIAALSLAGIVGARLLPDVAAPAGEALHVLTVLRRVAPFGITLALAAAGFSCFSSFVTLFFESRHWANGAFPLTVYGIAFVAVRLLLSRQIDRFGPYRVAVLSIGLELCGLLLLASADKPGTVFVASGLIGFGFSLVFPALCLQALEQVETRNRASAVAVYTAFIELSFSLTAPLAGAVVAGRGFRTAFLASCALALAAFLLALRLLFTRKVAMVAFGAPDGNS